jgi:large subunit ribosomal protein L4
MVVDVYNKNGDITGQAELRDEVFAITPNEHVMHQAVVAYLANQRQGTKKTKIRSEVSGGGKKPWRQKGRGTARSGSTRSPLWEGGGTVHGPKPIDYRIELPKKVTKLARRSALSIRAKEGNLLILEDYKCEKIGTKAFAEVLKNLKITNESVLFLIVFRDVNMYLSARNIPNVKVEVADMISTYDILKYRKIILFQNGIDMLQYRLMHISNQAIVNYKKK